MLFNIIPEPTLITQHTGKSIDLCGNIVFKNKKALTSQEELKVFFDKVINAQNKADKNLIIEFIESDKLPEEGYTLLIDGSVIIKASSESGFFYGIQTLKQLIHQYWIINSSPIPSVSIDDKPNYPYRGYMLDVSRHFFDVDTIINLLDVLAFHKINKFHFHITDDQGWRLEIKQYPKLTEHGAYRKHTTGDGKPHGGYYTQEEMKKIVEHAISKHIEVIPEIDLPGHFTAAISAYPELSCSGKAIEVATSFGIKTDIACAGKEETYKFFQNIIDELTEIFPSKYIHIGGDEAPKNEWESCKYCQEMIAKYELKNAEKLQGYMVNRIADYIESKGKSAIVWNESLNSGILKDSVICQYWSDGKEPLRVLNGISEGRKTIISKFTPYYLDYPYGMHSLKAVYSFAPELKGAQNKNSIIGMESPLWTEYVETKKQIDYQTFPRLTAVAEIAWSSPEHRDYDKFITKLKEIYPMYNIYGVLPAPLSQVNPNKIKGVFQIIRFFTKAITWESIKAFLNSYKAAKKVKSGRDSD